MKRLKIALGALALLSAQNVQAVGFVNSGCCEEEPCKVVKTIPCEPCECKVSSRTHFTERTQFGFDSIEYQSFCRQKARLQDNGEGKLFHAALFGGKSMDRGRRATYFTPHCENVLRVSGGSSISNNPTDVIADYFNVTTKTGKFESIVRFAPQESIIGVNLAYQQRFGEKENGKAYWFAITAPIMRVKNTMGFSEEVLISGDGAASENAPANMREAFSQDSWCFGKIDCNERSVTRLADIEALFGYDMVAHEKCRMEGYVGALIPTGNKVKTEYLYEPIAGREKHGGVMFGTMAQMQIWEDETGYRSLDYHIQIHSQYLFSNIQTRLIDLVDKPWSRFMYVYKNQAQQQAALNAGASGDLQSALTIGTPGVNVFAQNVRVSPGFERSISTVLEYTRCDLSLEVGYNYFCRPPECVDLECPWQEGPALRAQIRGGAVDNSILIQEDYGSRNSNVSPCNTDKLYSSYLIKECDLDLVSAEHPTFISHTFYGAIGYKWDNRDCPIFAGFGSSYEFTRDNTGSDRFNIWGKLGMTW